MAWRLSAHKGNSRIRSGSRRKELIQSKAKALRRRGYTVSVYETKRRR